MKWPSGYTPVSGISLSKIRVDNGSYLVHFHNLLYTVCQEFLNEAEKIQKGPSGNFQDGSISSHPEIYKEVQNNTNIKDPPVFR
jgi:hypothetical protein